MQHVTLFVRTTHVGQDEGNTFIQKREFFNSFVDNFVVEYASAENLVVRQESDGSTRTFFTLFRHALEVVYGNAALDLARRLVAIRMEAHFVLFAAPHHRNVEPL